jgi:hypothetical protein
MYYFEIAAAPFRLTFYYMLTPQTVADVGVYYLLWMALFLIINVTWDVCTTKTEPFHIEKMKEKTSILHSAAFFCSSLLMLLTIIEPNVWALAKETYLPIILAGASGVLTSIPALCPYSGINELRSPIASATAHLPKP